jgi:ADP-heptose:LPS heptosyltransferase
VSSLVIQLARLGDLLQSLPLCRALRERGELHLALAFDPGRRLRREADHVFVLEPWSLARASARPAAFLHRLRDALGAGTESALLARDYDRVVCLNEDPAALALARLARGVKRLGAGAPGDPYARWLRVMGPRRRENRLLLAEAMLALLPGRESPAPAAEPPGEGDVVLHAGSGSGHRRLPAAFWAGLALGLIEACDRRVLLTGGPEERAACRELEAAVARPDRLLNLCGGTDLDELHDLLERAALVVAQDTGVLHLAAHLRRPLIGLYHGPAWAWETAPWLAGAHVLQAVEDCSPCLEGAPCADFACRERLRPASAAALAAALLEGRRLDVGGGGCRHLVARADRGGVHLVDAAAIDDPAPDPERERQLVDVRGLSGGVPTRDESARCRRLDFARRAGMTAERWREREWGAPPRSLSEDWRWRAEAEMLEAR